MADSVPPSAPPPLQKSPHDDVRRARMQMGIALVVGMAISIVMFSTCLRKSSEKVSASGEAGDAATDAPSLTAVERPPDAAVDKRDERIEQAGFTLEGPLTTCGETTKPQKDACDRLPSIEKALSQAIEDAKGCVSVNEPGSIVYQFDVSFKRGRVVLSLPKEGRSVRDPKVVAACASAIRSKIAPLAIEGAAHTHTRYKISFTASYGMSAR